MLYTKSIKTAAIASALLLVSACGGGGGGGGNGTTVETVETKTYGGPFADVEPDGVTGAVAVRLEFRSDSTVRGSFTSTFGGSGDVDGEVSDGELSATLTLTGDCDGQYSIDGTLADGRSEIQGDFSGSDCVNSIPEGIFRLLETKPVNTNRGFSGTYVDVSFETVFALRTVTEDGQNYTGRALVFTPIKGSVDSLRGPKTGFALAEAQLTGSLNNEEGPCFRSTSAFKMRLGTTSASDVTAEPGSLLDDEKLEAFALYIDNIRTDGDGTSRLDGTWRDCGSAGSGIRGARLESVDEALR